MFIVIVAPLGCIYSTDSILLLAELAIEIISVNFEMVFVTRAGFYTVSIRTKSIVS